MSRTAKDMAVTDAKRIARKVFLGSVVRGEKVRESKRSEPSVGDFRDMDEMDVWYSNLRRGLGLEGF